MAAPLTDRRIGQVVLAQVTTGVGAITTTTTDVELPHIPSAVAFLIQVTAAATDVGDTLNITIETQFGSLWVPVYQATEFLGNGGAKAELSDKSIAQGAQAHNDSFPSTLVANLNVHLIGHRWRVAYVQVDADNDASFTFTVTAIIM